jgi:hypothetical protein
VKPVFSDGVQVEDESAWEFLPKMVEDFKRNTIQVSGNLPAYVTAWGTLERLRGMEY